MFSKALIFFTSSSKSSFRKKSCFSFFAFRCLPSNSRAASELRAVIGSTAVSPIYNKWQKSFVSAS